MKTAKIAFLVASLFFLFPSVQAQALSDQEKEFQSIGKMSLAELTVKAKAALEKKYPGEKWEKYRFPRYVYVNDAALVSYKIAVKEPDLPAKFPCYHFCEEMGHKNLLYCFLKQGNQGDFEEQASGCNTCNAEVMQVFLWNDLGVPTARMLQGLKEIYNQ